MFIWGIRRVEHVRYRDAFGDFRYMDDARLTKFMYKDNFNAVNKANLLTLQERNYNVVYEVIGLEVV